jgi:two-component system, NtrC family, sensor histidine kinase HydH
MKASIRPYRIPIAVTGMMVLAVAFWAWLRWCDIRDHELDMQRHFAMGISDSIEGTLRDLVGNERLPKDQTKRVLESIIRHSPIRFIILEQNDRRILQVGNKPNGVTLSNAQGQTRIGNIFVYRRKLQIQGDAHNDRINAQSDAQNPTSDASDLEIGRGDLTMILGVTIPPQRPEPPPPGEYPGPSPFPGRQNPPSSREYPGAPPPEQLEHQNIRQPPNRQGVSSLLMDMYVTVVVAMLFITASLIAWIMAIQSRLLTEQLKGERTRHAYLEELGLASAGLAHETKNPLGIISGIAQQIIADPDEPKQSRALLEHILDEVDKATARLGNFMAFARQRQANAMSVNARDAILKVATILTPDFTAADVKLDVDCPVTAILADEEMLRQVLVNLLLNSLHASPAGKNVVVRLSRQGAQAMLQVEDQGCGIAAELLPNIFKPYIAGDSHGHGLGLAIVKRFVEEHGWAIHVDSHPGRGTLVSISGIVLSESLEP